MLLLKCFSQCIGLLPFPISPIALPSGTTSIFHYSEILEKTQHFALKMCSHEWFGLVWGLGDVIIKMTLLCAFHYDVIIFKLHQEPPKMCSHK